MISGDNIAPRLERHPVRAFQLALGAQLRAMFAPIIDEPMPAELLARLAQLDRTPGRRGG